MLPACFLHASCVLPACFLRASFYTATAGAGLTSTYKLNWTETHTIWSTFLGSMQEAHMGATCVLPSVASLTGRAVFIWAKNRNNYIFIVISQPQHQIA